MVHNKPSFARLVPFHYLNKENNRTSIVSFNDSRNFRSFQSYSKV